MAPEPTTKISGFIGKMAQAGPLVGGFVGLLSAGEGVGGIMDSFQRAASGQIHAPSQFAFNRWGIAGQGLMLTIGGVILKSIGGGIHPALGKVGQFLSGFGGGMIGGGVAGGLLYDMTHSDGAPAGQPYPGHDGYPAGAGYSPLGRPGGGGHFTMPTVPPATPTLPTILPRSPRPGSA